MRTIQDIGAGRRRECSSWARLGSACAFNRCTPTTSLSRPVGLKWFWMSLSQTRKLFLSRRFHPFRT